MPLGHLLLGLLVAILASAATLLAGWGIWMALLMYVVAGNAAFLGSLALELALERWEAARTPAPKRERAPVDPAPVWNSSRAAAQAVAGSASRARPAMAAKASGS